MIKKMKLALSAATAVLAFAGLTAAPQASADELSDLQARIAKLEKADAEQVAASKDNMVFFRGGYARNDYNRKGDILTDTAGAAGQSNGDQNGWYVGAGFDFSLSDDLFGLHDGTEILAEIMFDYKEFDNAALGAAALPTVAGLPNTANQVTVGQFTLSASPKIKFLKGSDFRPWIIPVGLSLHVISPPSDGVTVLDPGIQFAAGADYRVWNDIYVGADIRYQLTFGDLDGVNTEGFTTGGYVGIGF